jgi:Holliday junction DNA helicase RuvB
MSQETSKIRPKRLKDFVGQSSAVRQIKISLLSAMRRKAPFPHMMMAGPPGLGKTTLAEIIAEEMGVDFKAVLASGIKDDSSIESLLSDISSNGYNLETGDVEDPALVRPMIIFVDEIHNLKKSCTETLHTALEDFKITLRKKCPITGVNEAGLYWIPQFTMIGATNYLGSLPKPFVDRFPLQFNFETYNPEEMLEVLKFSSGKMGLEASVEALKVIATKSRGVPRIGNRFLSRCRDVSICFDEYGGKIDEKCVEATFENLEIDELGLTNLDRKVLRYLAKVKRAVGLTSIAQGVDEDRKTIEFMIEPWLVQLNLIVKTPRGRQITKEGYDHLGEEQQEKVSTTGLRRIM